MSKAIPIETVKELRELLKQAIKPSLCRFATQDDYIESLLEVKDIIEELRTIKELK